MPFCGRYLIAGMAFASTCLSPALQAQAKLTQSQADQRGAQITAQIQRQRAAERAEIQKAFQDLLSKPSVRGNAKSVASIQALQAAILAARDRTDREMPADVVGWYKAQATGRMAPPIPGKQGALNGEARVRNYMTREENEQQQLMQVEMQRQAQLQQELQAMQRSLLDLHRKLTQNLISLLTG